ncbi:hypothetical protein LBWT_X0470 (plasmid) [Leptolyngbya boryana IAM M-101]|nr:MULTISPECIES: hypothetical protein [Leptolyngbya]BAS59975.1 hypothetical protein LBWT_X0470 [Leptolyngbya boryana IAM M-101]BAS66323.1 hypothetical protein LBDG_X0470 [Leptolyngbya boryana dg5]
MGKWGERSRSSWRKKENERDQRGDRALWVKGMVEWCVMLC